jgi:2'-5' RNA ligase
MDVEAITRHDWAAFDQLTEMNNHWLRPGWTPTTRRYYWFLTVDHVPEIARATKDCQAAIEPLGFDAVPIDGLHITVARIAESAAISRGQIVQLAAAAERNCQTVPRFTVDAIPLTGSRGAIRYTIAPWKPMWDLHRAVTSACLEFNLREFKPTNNFHPHLGIAYSNRAIPTTIARRIVASQRDSPSINIPVNQVLLVELRREGNEYQWDTLHRVPLAMQSFMD